MTPTARTLHHLRKLGYRAAIVEKWNPFAKVRQDSVQHRRCPRPESRRAALTDSSDRDGEVECAHEKRSGDGRAMGEHGKPVPILGVEQGRKERPAKDMAINSAEPRCGRLSGGPVRVDGFGWSCSGSGQQIIDRQAQDRGDAEQHQHEQPWRNVVQHGFSSAFRDPFVLRLDRFRRRESLPRSFGSSPMSWRPPTTLFPQPSGLPFHCRMRKSRARLQLKNIAIFRTKTGLGSTFAKGGPRNQRATRLVTTNRGIWRAIVPTSAIRPPESPSLQSPPESQHNRGHVDCSFTLRLRLAWVSRAGLASPKCGQRMYVEILSAGTVADLAPVWLWACACCGMRLDALILRRQADRGERHCTSQ